MRTRRIGGFTLIELLIVVAIIGVVTAIAVPGLLRARMSGNEASAIGSLRAINSGEASYASSCAHGGYAIDLADLVKAPSGTDRGFVSPDLASNGIVKSGYAVTLAKEGSAGVLDIGTAAGTCNGSGSTPASAYWGSAVPTKPEAGIRYFATDIRGTLFQDAAALPNPIPSGKTAVQ